MWNPAPIERGPLNLSDVPVPDPGHDEVLIKISACGVCRTDLHVVEGDLPAHKSPLTPGHQIVGTVEKAGDGVQNLKPGDLVGVPWLYQTCGTCDLCKADRENLCADAKFTGYDLDGGYAEYLLAREGFTYPLPKDFPDVQAAPLLCAGVIGYRALQLAQVPEGGRLGLYGFGASAHIVIQLAVHMGYKVYVFSRSEEHRSLAKELGAAWTGPAQDGPPERLHSSIIFAPVGHLVPVALESLEKGGTVSLAGIYMTQIPELNYVKHLYHEKTLRSAANSTRRDVREVLHLAAEIPIRTEVQSFPLEKANEALTLMKDGKIQGAAVLDLS